MTEPTKEQVDKWKDEFEEKYLGYKPERTWNGYFETEIHMRYLAFECAKKSDFEEIESLRAQRYEYYAKSEQIKVEIKTLKEQLEVERTKIKELTALIVNYMGMTEEEKEKYYETVLTFSRKEKIEHSVRKILNALRGGIKWQE